MMRILKGSIFLASILVLLFSCKKEDEKPANSFTYNGKTYQIKYVELSKFLPDDVLGDGDTITHQRYFVYLSDGDFINADIDEDLKASYWLTFEVYVPYVDKDQEFTGGSFDYVAFKDLWNDDKSLLGKNLFTPVIILDENSNGILDDSEPLHDLGPGSLEISGSGTNFSITFKVIDESSGEFEGSFSGAVSYYEWL